MAEIFPKSEPILDLDQFESTKLSIQSTFDLLVQKLIKRRDHFLVELHKMKVSYLNKEKTRKNSISALDQLIQGIEQTTIEPNLIIKMKEEQIENVKAGKESYEIPTPIPLPHFTCSDRGELQHHIEMFGSLEDITTRYTTKQSPLSCIGRKGVGKLEFNNARGLVLDGKGNLIIADTFNGRIQVISLEGHFIEEFGKGKLVLPYYIALYKDFIFVTDFSLNKVLKFLIKSYPLVCKSVLELKSPLGLTVDDEEVFVADCYNDRVIVLSLDLKFIREFRHEKLVQTTDVRVNINKVFVSNKSKPHNIHIFSKLGDLLHSIISLKDGTDDVYLCFDRFNNIIVSDSKEKVIQIYTLQGQLVHSIECDGYYPTGVAVTDDNIIVCVDWSNDRIYFY